jgi:hypothetical protein
VDIGAVLDEMSVRLKTIAGLSVQDVGYAKKLARVPAAVLYPPERVIYDATYARGSDVLDDIHVAVFVGAGTWRQSWADLKPYLAGSGAKSIKAKLDDSGAAPYASCSALTVYEAELDPAATFAEGTYVAGIFRCKIFGSGT